MFQRLKRNIPSISEKECKSLRSKSVFIAGCGGLGGYLAELSARVGFGTISLCDGDCFEESNMNRQFGCTTETLGKPKVTVTGSRLMSINPDLHINMYNEMLSASNAVDFLHNSDIILDGLDSGESRIILENAATELNIPILHGAVSGWWAQVALVLPGSGILKKLYSSESDTSGNSGCLPFVPSICASVQVAEAIKYVLGKDGISPGKLLSVDALCGTFETIDL